MGNDIMGWMADEELDWLYNAACEMDNIVEIGSWKGRSTHALLTGCKGPVHAVDHWKGSWNELKFAHQEAKHRDIYLDFLNNVGYFNNLKVLKTDSVSASRQFEDDSVDMVFIDGCHTFGAVTADIKAWLSKTRKVICGHDYEKTKSAVKKQLGSVHQFYGIWWKLVNGN